MIDFSGYIFDWTAIATAATAIATIIGVLIARLVRKGEIEITDISISDNPIDYKGSIYKFPIINVTVRNTGGKSAVITCAEFEVHDIWPLVLQFPLMQALPISCQYDVIINPKEDPPYTKQVTVSHILKADEADKFSFSFGVDPVKPFESIFYFSLTLVFNKNRRTDPVNIFVVMPDTSSKKPRYFLRDFNKSRNEYLQNKKFLEEHALKNNIDIKSPEVALIKQARESLYNSENARKIDEHNRFILNKVIIIGGTVSSRLSQLINSKNESEKSQ